jgi:hypothetical protein
MEDSSANYVMAPGCSYATLAHYNAPVHGGTSRPPVAPGTTSGHYIVPVYGGTGYDVLTGKGPGSCNGYFNITTAYGGSASQCSAKYVSKLCQ